MSYIGSQPTTAAFPFDQFSGTGAATSFTLTYAPAGATSILVAISGVMQNPNLYSVIGTTLSFSPAPPAGTNNIAVLYLGLPVIGSSSPGNTAFLSSTDLTATAGQTVFASAGSYTPGFVQVYRNGARLGNADFTATNGTTITLTNAATAGDLVTIEYYTLTSLVNALPLTGGTVTGSVTIQGLTVGRGAGAVATNTALGLTALAANTSGDENVGVGHTALTVTTTGSANTAVGSRTMRLNTTGNFNSSLGYATLIANTTGANNTAIGASALQFNTTASNNTAVGYQAGYSNTTGAYNLFMGYITGLSNTTGSQNTFVGGLGAGNAVTTGGKHTIIGNYSGNNGGLDIRTSSNNIVLSDGDGNPRIVTEGVGITTFYGTNTNWSTRMVNAGTGTQYFTDFRINTPPGGVGTQVGYIYYNGSSTIYSTSSDQRLKENIVDAPSAVNDVMAIKIRSFDWIESKHHQKYGVVAQELQAIAPDAVATPKDESDMLGVDYSLLVPMLVKAIQELKAEFDAYKDTHP